MLGFGGVWGFGGLASKPSTVNPKYMVAGGLVLGFRAPSIEGL